MASSHKLRSHCCFNERMQVQEKELNELVDAQTLTTNTENSENLCIRLTKKIVKNYEEYMEKRSQLFHEEASGFFAPGWCSSLENSSHWIGGCRPSSFIRLLYAQDGSKVESLVAELLSTTGTNNASQSSLLSGLTSKQMGMINNFHMKTIKKEDKMTTMLASLQEDVVDQPISVMANPIGEPNSEVERALDKHDAALANILQEADNFRLCALNELLSILTPAQNVDFLAAGKKVHLDIHERGIRRDNKHDLTWKTNEHEQ